MHFKGQPRLACLWAFGQGIALAKLSK